MKKLLILALLACSTWVNAQDKIIIIENNLAELGTFDKYNLHTYTKQFLKNNGYTVYFENEIPKEYINNRCAAKYVNFKDTSTMLSTKLIMQLKDCSGKVVFETQESKSKEKTYVSAYREAFRIVAKEFSLKKDYIANYFKEDATYLPPVVEYTKVLETKVTSSKMVSNNLNFEFENGKQEGILKDGKGNVLYKITKTSVENLYMASNTYVDGIIFTKGDKWYFEFTKNGNKVLEEIK